MTPSLTALWRRRQTPFAFTDAAGTLLANAPMQRLLGCDERACGNNSPLVSLFLSLPDYLEGGCPRPVEDWPVDDMFSDRERGIIFLSLQRLSSKRIGQRLQISHRTVENRLQNIYQKMGIHNVRQLDDYCRQQGLMYAIPPQWRPGVSHIMNP